MKCASGPTGKVISLYSYAWRFVLAAGLCISTLAIFFSSSAVSPSVAFAAPRSFAARTFTVSPTQGPVGAVITVSSSRAFYPDGTQVAPGYTVDSQTCITVSGGQLGVVHNHTFSSWFRWPAGTGTGSFGICLTASGFGSIQVGTYQALSDAAPHVSVAPTGLNAGKQATVTGSNYLPAGSSVDLIWRSANGGQSISLGSVSSDASGKFTHTFIVPAHASTGSYTLTGVVGAGQPPTLSAMATFHVNGITIVVVPTPTAYPSPTATAAATAVPRVVGTNRPDKSQVASVNKASPLLPIALGGSLLIVLALVSGVFVVRRQRGLATVATASSKFSWHGVSNMMTNVFAAVPGAAYPMGNLPPPGSTTHAYVSMSHGSVTVDAKQSRATTIPFDPGLVEAMQQAQISLFATPRPPVGEEMSS